MVYNTGICFRLPCSFWALTRQAQTVGFKKNCNVEKEQMVMEDLSPILSPSLSPRLDLEDDPQQN